MIKSGQVVQIFNAYGFGGLNERKKGKENRFRVSAFHERSGVRITVSAPRTENRRVAVLEITDASCRPIPGIDLRRTITRLSEVQKVAESIVVGRLTVA